MLRYQASVSGGESSLSVLPDLSHKLSTALEFCCKQWPEPYGAVPLKS